MNQPAVKGKIEIKKDEKEVVKPETPSVKKVKLEKLFEVYKQKNPVKAAQKAEHFAKQLAALK